MKHLNELSMTELELSLKDCLSKRPDVQSHILTGCELQEYTEWMAKAYGHTQTPQRQAQLLASFQVDGKLPMAALGKRLMSNPGDPGAIELLSQQWGSQTEGSYIAPEQDISAWRMLRYMPAHWHENQYFEVYYSFSGNCPIYFQNEIVTVKPGSVLIVAPHVLHANPCYGDDMVLIYYNIRSSTFDRVFWNQIPTGNLMSGFFRQALSGKEPNSYLHFETDRDAEIQRLLANIFKEYLQGGEYASKLMNAYMSTCLILLLQRYESTVRLPRTETFYWKHEYSAILSYIQAHFTTVRLEELSEHFHYSEKQIRRIVQSTTGMSYSDLLAKLRMERAGLLMKRVGLGMDDIASAVGYTTVSSFYRAFSAYYGITPAEYRRTAALD